MPGKWHSFSFLASIWELNAFGQFCGEFYDADMGEEGKENEMAEGN